MTDVGNHNADPAANLEKRKQNIYDEKDFVTGRISETCRYIGYGLLAIFYTLHSSENAFAKALLEKNSSLLYIMAVSGTAAIVFDYLQYLFGNLAAEQALRETGANQYLYNKKWISYRGRNFCFVLKQITALVGSAVLLWIVTFRS